MNTELINAFSKLVDIMDELRVKCPWDKKQTIESLRQLTIEETYELADAITEKDWQGIREELGDLLLHIVFYAKIGQERGQFTLEEAIQGINQKLINRHPHVFGSNELSAGIGDVQNEEDVKRNWESIKLKEGKKSVLSGVPGSLPATVKAMRLQEKAKQVGFEWENRDQVWEKVEEEMKELQLEVARGDRDKIEAEYGDLIFSLVNYARFLHIDAENALERTNKKFIRRFTQMEQQSLANGKPLNDLTLDEMDALWNGIKQQGQ